MPHVKRFLAAILAMLGLTGCGLLSLTPSRQDFQQPPPAEQSAEKNTFTPAKDCGGEFTPQQRIYLELVHKMVKQGQFYAAIANLDQLEKSATASPQTLYLRAEALRGIGQRDAAEKQYRLLLNGCMASYGLHGLGLLATQGGQLAQAEEYLAHACRERPIDADAHNDLGMVLLLRGNRQNARQELLTAMQLDRGNRLPAENLIVLMLMEKQHLQAQQLAAERGIKTQEMEHLAQRAQYLIEATQANNDPTRP